MARQSCLQCLQSLDSIGGQEMNNFEIVSQEQLEQQSGPFNELWSCRTNLSDGVYLAPLRDHALGVLRVVASLSNGGAVNTVWDGVYHNLHQAISLESIGLYTDVHGEGLMCSSAYDHDMAFSRVKERFVAGQLVFQGAWNAFEASWQSLFSPGMSPRINSVRHKLANGAHQPILGFKETMYDAHKTASKYIDIKHAAYREAIAKGSDLGIAAELLRQFRNGILHGKIRSLEPWDWGPGSKDKTCEKQTELFHAQVRLILILLQAIIGRAEAKHELHWPNDGDLVEELVFALQRKTPEGLVDCLDEDIDAPGLFADQKYIHQV